MRKLICLSFFITVAACSQKSSSAGAAGSGGTITTENQIFKIEGGMCAEIEFTGKKAAAAYKEAVKGGEKGGSCPTSIKVGGKTAKELTNCGAMEGESSDDDVVAVVTTHIYDKMEGEDGTVTTITKTQAAAICESMLSGESGGEGEGGGDEGGGDEGGGDEGGDDGADETE